MTLRDAYTQLVREYVAVAETRSITYDPNARQIAETRFLNRADHAISILKAHQDPNQVQGSNDAAEVLTRLQALRNQPSVDYATMYGMVEIIAMHALRD